MSLGKIIGRGQSGQIVLEYVLLLTVAVAVAALMTRLMVSRNPESPGFLITKWISVVNFVGKDTADDLAPTK